MVDGPNVVVEGNNVIKDVYAGSSIIAQIYHGSDLVFSHYPVQGVVFEQKVAGSYTFTPTIDGMYEFDIVGAGGGGAHGLVIAGQNYYWYSSGGGGSGAYAHGYISLTKGTEYSIVIGAGGTGSGVGTAGNGGYSSVFGQTAGGGSGGHTGWIGETDLGGAGGTATTTYEGISGNKGAGAYNNSSGCAGADSVFGGYGYGAPANSSQPKGGDGYARIKYLGNVLYSNDKAGNYSFTPDIDGLYEIRLVGAGGGGASAPDYQKYAWKSGNAGGGSGSYIRARYRLTRGTNYQITIGAGGAGYPGGYLSGGAGGTGGTSTFADLITCGGGTGGYARWTDGVPAQTAGIGGTASASGYTVLLSNTSGNNGNTKNGWSTATGGQEVYLGGAGGSGSSPYNTTNGQDGLIQILYISS